MMESFHENSIQKASNYEPLDQRTQQGKLLLIGAGLKRPNETMQKDMWRKNK